MSGFFVMNLVTVKLKNIFFKKMEILMCAHFNFEINKILRESRRHIKVAKIIQVHNQSSARNCFQYAAVTQALWKASG